MSPFTHVVSAQPRTYVLIGALEANQFSVTKINVVAWAAIGDSLVPVTVAGPNHGQEDAPSVLQPDGSVEEAKGSVFASQDEWKRVAVKRARAAEFSKAA